MKKIMAMAGFLTALSGCSQSDAYQSKAEANKPNSTKLVVQITVDALRGDLLHRYHNILGEKGFRYLLEEGVYYNNSHYQHANTETIVGHSSLATGATPAIHGMVGNVWFDRSKDRMVYNIEDARYTLLSKNADVDKNVEIDPTQKAAKVEGRSPAAILSSTFSDELALHYAGKSKVFAVSVKDRGAVSLAGHAGKAFWFSKANGEFVTSSYYYDRYPQWVNDWNSQGKAASYAGKSWQLLLDPKKYLFGAADDQDFETDFPGFGRTFPHKYGERGDKYLTTRLTLSPAGDNLTLDFAKTLLVNEQLGQDEIPDFLSISFSSTDYVGHIFGASSLESEDNLAHLDRSLENLFAFIDEKVGLKNTLIVLSADHGQPESPGYLASKGIHNSHYFDPKALDKGPAMAALKAQYGVGKELIEAYFPPYIYLDHDLIKNKGIDKEALEKTLITELLKFDGVAAAISSSAIQNGDFPESRMNTLVSNNFQPTRSGDIHLVLKPNVFVNDFGGLSVSSVHGSPWNYDTFVPMIFAGAGLQAQQVSRPTTPYDIAPTLAAFLGIKAPDGSIGDPLPEVAQ